jgi:lipopolysaccharide/colanic/teichoic acid biosynthesis glycosyltransferase
MKSRQIQEPAKRLFDLAVAGVGLILLAPLLVTIGAFILVADGPPALFRQVRVGRGGRPFILLKFRTMRAGEGAGEGAFEPGSTGRVTPAGRLLRLAKLDELPQLWNVVRGDMSLVGPRPEVRRWVNVYPERWGLVHTVRPGITDPASIRFRHEEEILRLSSDPEKTYGEEILPQKLDLYEDYVLRHSLGGDLRILWQTALALGRLRGAAGGANDLPRKPNA